MSSEPIREQLRERLTYDEAIGLVQEAIGQWGGPERQHYTAAMNLVCDNILNHQKGLDLWGRPLDVEALLGAMPLMSDETFKQRADEENGQMVSVCCLPSERNSMTREQAIEIARHCAKAKPQSYYSEPFQPHEWVIDAILLGARLHGAQYVPAESAAPERDSQKVDPPADRPTFRTPHAASLVESVKTTVSSRTTTNGPCYDPLSPADAGKELRALSAKWRKPGAGIVSHEFDGPIAVEQFYDASRLQCADELDAVLALISEGEKR